MYGLYLDDKSVGDLAGDCERVGEYVGASMERNALVP